MSARLRRRGALAASVLLLGPLLAACSDSPSEPGPGTSAQAGELPAPMPDLVLPGMAGDVDLNLSEIDRPTLVNVWATWCAPCRTEMPLLQEFSEKYEGRVEVLGINFQDPQSELAEKFLDETGVSYPSVRDVEGVINRAAPFPELRGLPFMVVVDGEGQAVGREFAVAHSVADLEELVEKYLPGALAAENEESE